MPLKWIGFPYMDKSQPEQESDSLSDSMKNENINESKQHYTFEQVDKLTINDSLNQSHETHQSVDGATKEFPIDDPNGLNSKVDFYQSLLRVLPIPNEYIDHAFGGAGLLGSLGTLLFVLNQLPQSNTYSVSVAFPVILAVPCILLAMVGIGFFTSRETSTCPSCKQPFGLKVTETVKYPELSNETTLRGRQTTKCQFCEYSSEEEKEWNRNNV